MITSLSTACTTTFLTSGRGSADVAPALKRARDEEQSRTPLLVTVVGALLAWHVARRMRRSAASRTSESWTVTESEEYAVPPRPGRRRRFTLR